MSIIEFKTIHNNEVIKVVSGWDPPQSYYHLTIYNDHALNETGFCISDHIFYDGFSKLGFCRDLEKIKSVLINFDITPPKQFYELISNKSGNIIYTWNNETWEEFDLR